MAPPPPVFYRRVLFWFRVFNLQIVTLDSNLENNYLLTEKSRICTGIK